MKEYIVLTIVENTIVFNYRNVSDDEKVFINKNRIYKDSLFYTLKYYKNNFKKITDVLHTNANNNVINSLKIMRLVTFKYVIPLINNFNIESLVLDFSSTLDIKDYDLFLGCKTLKNIYCYYMPLGILNKFKDKMIDYTTLNNMLTKYGIE